MWQSIFLPGEQRDQKHWQMSWTDASIKDFYLVTSPQSIPKTMHAGAAPPGGGGGGSDLAVKISIFKPVYREGLKGLEVGFE